MGWNSANEIFDPVCEAILQVGIAAEKATEILRVLISKLQDGDWDTEDESLDEFGNEPVVVDAFRKCGISRDDMYEPEEDYATGDEFD